MAAEPKRSYEGSEKVTDTRSVSGRFIREDSLQGQASALRGISQHANAANAESLLFEEAVNEAAYAEEERQKERLGQRVVRARRQALRARRMLKGGGKGVLRATGALRAGPVFWTAACVSFFQSLFGLISLAGLGAQALTDEALGTGVGKVVGAVVGFFTDARTLIPFEDMALAFWGIATVIGLGGFIGFFIYFYITGISIYRSTISILTTSFLFALSMCPVTNIIPSVFLWVFIMVVGDLKDQLTGGLFSEKEPAES